MRTLLFVLLVPLMLFGAYREYSVDCPQRVVDHYMANHTQMTLEYVLEKKREYGSLNKLRMTIFEAIALVDSLVDESDPDIDLPQSYHFYQTAEAIRRDGHPRWLILTGFIHDLGKVLATFGEPQWAVVGDTFPVGCRFAERIIFPSFFADNPDLNRFQGRCGIYSEHCGLDNLHMSWGHDEYFYTVLKGRLPEEALYIIRFHSFYAHHQEGAYNFLMNEKDHALLPFLKLFQKYDLYSKSNTPLDPSSLRNYYEQLVDEFLPGVFNW